MFALVIEGTPGEVGVRMTGTLDMVENAFDHYSMCRPDQRCWIVSMPQDTELAREYACSYVRQLYLLP